MATTGVSSCSISRSDDVSKDQIADIGRSGVGAQVGLPSTDRIAPTSGHDLFDRFSAHLGHNREWVFGHSS